MKLVLGMLVGLCPGEFVLDGDTYKTYKRDMNIGRAVRGGRWIEKKRVQHRKKSPILGEALSESIYIKNCVVGDVVDVITCAKFHGPKFPFSYSFWNGPYNNAELLRCL